MNGVLPPWMGPLELDRGASAEVTLGALTVWLGRGRDEWRVAHALSRDVERREARIAREVAEPDPDADVQRWAFARDVPAIVLEPAPADRPLVMRPDVPLQIPVGAAVTLYVGTPVWLQLRLAEVTLLDLPSFRLSDTWFGPSTTRGELCYAVRTKARLDPAQFEPRANRVIVPVTIQNRQDRPLAVASLKLPATFLSLHADGQGRLWAPTVRVVRDEANAAPEVRIEAAPPAEAGACAPAAAARQRVERGLLGRAFGALA